MVDGACTREEPRRPQGKRIGDCLELEQLTGGAMGSAEEEEAAKAGATWGSSLKATPTRVEGERAAG